MIALRTREHDLFSRWPCDDDKGFVRDGAGNEFENQTIRILFVLKEPNDVDNGDQDFRELLDCGGPPRHYQTWANIARWTAAVLDRLDWSAVADMKLPEDRARYSRRIAFMNLKKQPGTSKSTSSIIQKYAHRDATLLREQMSLYNPHLTIAAGTFGFVQEEVLKISKDAVSEIKHDTGDPTFWVKNPTINVLLSFCHPLCFRQSPQLIFEEFKRAISSIPSLELGLRRVPTKPVHRAPGCSVP